MKIQLKLHQSIRPRDKTYGHKTNTAISWPQTLEKVPGYNQVSSTIHDPRCPWLNPSSRRGIDIQTAVQLTQNCLPLSLHHSHPRQKQAGSPPAGRRRARPTDRGGDLGQSTPGITRMPWLNTGRSFKPKLGCFQQKLSNVCDTIFPKSY